MGALDCIAYTALVIVLVVLSHEFILLLRNIMTNSLVVSIMSRFLLDRLLDVIDVILDTHLFVVSIALT